MLKNKKNIVLITYLSSLVILLAIYFPVLDILPFGDDYIYIFDNPHLKDTTDPFIFWDVSSEYYKSWPLNFSFLWILFNFFGENVLGYRLVLLLLHFFNGALIRKIYQEKYGKDSNFIFMFYLFHPIFIVSNIWIFQIKTVLSSTFVLISVLFFLKNKPKTSFLFFMTSLLTKVSGVLLPIALFKKLKNAYLIPLLILTSLIVYTSIDGLKHLIGNNLLVTPLKSFHSFSTEFFVSKIDFTFMSLSFFIQRFFGLNNKLFITYLELTSSNLFINYSFLILFLFILYRVRRSIFFIPLLLSLIPVIGIIHIPFQFLVFFSDHWYHLPAIFFMLIISNYLSRKPKLMYLILFTTFLVGFFSIRSFKDLEFQLKKEYQKYPSQITGEYLVETLKRTERFDLALSYAMDIYPTSNRKEVTLEAIAQISNRINSQKGKSFYHLEKTKVYIRQKERKKAIQEIKKVNDFFCNESCQELKLILNQ